MSRKREVIQIAAEDKDLDVAPPICKRVRGRLQSCGKEGWGCRDIWVMRL